MRLAVALTLGVAATGAHGWGWTHQGEYKEGTLPIYTRWGHNDCGENAIRIYRGFPGASHMWHRGSSSTPACLTGNPKPKYTTGSGMRQTSDNSAMVYGIQYKSHSSNRGASNMPERSDAACAVCRAKQPGEIYTNWGSFTCPEIHRTLYNGWVMSGWKHSDHRMTDYTCVDDAFETHDQSDSHDRSGGEWWTVEAQSGSMNEEWYPNDSEVFCSVCQVPIDYAQGEIFTRWGHNDCPKHTKFIYTGLVGASGWWWNDGGSTTSICLTRDSNIRDPSFHTDEGGGGRNMPNNQDQPEIRGVEYHHQGINQYENDDFQHMTDAACAVCQMREAGHVFTAWGSVSCTDQLSMRRSYSAVEAYTLYHGNVFSDKWNHKRSQYHCVDDQMGSHTGTSQQNTNARRWYNTITEDGSMWRDRDNQNWARGKDNADKGYPGGNRNRIRKYYNWVEVGCSVCGIKTQPDHEGDIYVRWGHQSCPDTASALYQGLIAGARWDNNGGGTNKLCLTYEPSHNYIDRGWWTDMSRLHGAQYHNHDGGFPDSVNGDSRHDDDMGCVVCQVKAATNGWIHWGGWECPAANADDAKKGAFNKNADTIEYQGIGMAERWNHRASEFICVDWERQRHAGSHNGWDHDTNRLYVMEVRDGSSWSEKYRNGDEVYCSFCKAHDCPAGEYKEEFASACKACTECPAGEYEDPMQRCTTHSDRKCIDCPEPPADEGYYMDPVCSHANGAGEWHQCSAECGDDMYELVGCNMHHDRICEPLSTCDSTQYELREATATSDVLCADLTDECDPSTEWEAKAATKTSDRVCFNYKSCKDFEYADKDSMSCVPYSRCLDSEYQIAAGTDTTDAQCKAHSNPCRGNQFESKAPTGFADRECSPLRRCANGEYESKAPTPYTDRECSTRTTCKTGQFAVSAGTDTTDTVCGDNINHPCEPGKYISRPGSRSSPRVCGGQCTVCKDDEVMIKPCVGTENRVCEKAKVTNGSYQYEGQPAVTTTDGVIALAGKNVRMATKEGAVDGDDDISLLLQLANLEAIAAENAAKLAYMQQMSN